MAHKERMRMVEICPQCHKEVDGTKSRLVSDGCGHPKCRICLLQEINGCLKCAASKLEPKPPEPPIPSLPKEPEPRRSVIMSTNALKTEQQDRGTRQVIQQSLQKDILFPTDIVKQTSGNFFHLKRLISARYYKEGGGKEDKSCETEAKGNRTEKNESEKLPPHIVYFCAVHQKSLTGASSLEKHKKCDGLSISEVSCDVCPKKFPNFNKLNRHKRSHLPPPKFHCPDCKKNFKDNYALNTHKRIHTGHKAYTCHICHAQLKQLWSLKRHLAAHLGDKKYSCDNCNGRFVSKAELNRHMVSHSKTKAFMCKACNSKFSTRRSLMRHNVIHNSKTAQLCCGHCGATFKRKDNLLRHEKNIHSAESVIDPDCHQDLEDEDSQFRDTQTNS